MPSIQWFNDLDAARVREALRACCAAPAWIEQLAAGRPYSSRQDLVTTGRKAAEALPWDGVHAALAAHPRIGDRAKGDDRDATWSRGEQSGMSTAAEQTATALAEANQAYENRFGHVFLICATGLSAERMLAEARRRLGNSPEAEQVETTHELAKIVELRLEKLVTA
jgi:2-oxo-4-hydroxy-4-carboxy-5-ureidoimidazoline decarboxylase